MSNSSTVFIAVLAFLLFGYISLLRLLVKRELGRFSTFSLFAGIRDSRVLTSLGSSAFFVSMPATSLLLFWGWVPALLWLVVFHLFVESLFQLQYTTTEQDYSLAELLVKTESPKVALLESTLVQSFFILLMSTVVTLLAVLINKQSGLLFALIALFPAQQFLRNSNGSIPFLVKLLSAALIITIGVLFAHQLGFAIYGDWTPVTKAPMAWLRINNTTVIAGLLIIVSFLLAEKTEFQKDIATLAGTIIVLLIVAMCARLLWLRPLLEAPMNATQSTSSNLPLFISISLFTFAGLGALLIRLLNDETNYDDIKTSASCFSRLQLESFVQMVFLTVLILSLAAAFGIGSWKTHYTQWSSEINFFDHLNLAITNTLQLVHSSLKTGTFTHTIIMVAMCVAGVSFLMMCVSRFKITRHSRAEDKSFIDVVLSNKVPQAIIIFFLSCYLIEHGVTITVWLMIGMLSWALVVHLMLGITRDMPDASLARQIYGGVCLGLIALGAVQMCWLAIAWIIDARYVYAGITFAILGSCAILWSRSISELIQRFFGNTESKLFDSE